MDPLSVTASVIAVLQLSAKVLSYLSNVKDASNNHAKCMIEASMIYGLLTSLKFRLEEGRNHEPWFNAVKALAIENGPLDQFKEALETLQTKLTDGGRLKKASEALIWKFKKADVDDTLARMERLKTLVEIALQLDHFKLSQAIKGDTTSIRTNVSAIQSTVSEVRQEQASANHSILLEWISSSDYPAQHSDIIKRRQKGTGQWFLSAPEVVRWQQEAKATLFCPGIPAAEKTMLAAIAIEHLLDSATSDTYVVAYVYCNYKSRADQDVAHILSAILKQIGQATPSVLEPLERLHRKFAGRGTRPPTDDLFSALRDVAAQSPYVYIVVDALDECQHQTRQELIAKLLDLQKVADIRLMATSRFIPDIENAFRSAIQLEVRASEEDIRHFVAGQMYRLPICIQRNTMLQQLVQDKIAEVVDGMFLLASLHTDSLLDKRTVKDVKSTLNMLRTGKAALDSAYDAALQRIESQLHGDKTLAKKVLTWITFAKRPLTTAEICCALAIEPGDEELDPESELDIDDIISVCAGLVIVDRESAIIRLVHYTTQDYCESNSTKLGLGGHLLLATTCLTYLSFHVFESGRCNTDEECEERLHQHKLLDYAAKHGCKHARHVDGHVTHLARRIWSSHGLLSNVFRFSHGRMLMIANNGHVRHGFRCDPTFTGLHLAAQFELRDVAQDLLQRSPDEFKAVNAEDKWGRTPLTISVQHGHYEMTKMLLEKNAVINRLTTSQNNALSIALRGYHLSMVELLLVNGADIHDSDAYANAFYDAVIKGHEDIVKLMLDKAANVNVRNLRGTALALASYRGNHDIIKLLLHMGADADLQHGKIGTALIAASWGRHKDTVKLLLDYGADPNIQRTGRTALSVAKTTGNELIIKLLREAGAVDL